MPIYLEGGQILLEGGAIAVHEDCCCDEDIIIECPCSPATLPGIPQVGVVLNGVITGDMHCSTLWLLYAGELLNKRYTIPRLSEGCQWRNDTSDEAINLGCRSTVAAGCNAYISGSAMALNTILLRQQHRSYNVEL